MSSNNDDDDYWYSSDTNRRRPQLFSDLNDNQSETKQKSKSALNAAQLNFFSSSPKAETQKTQPKQNPISTVDTKTRSLRSSFSVNENENNTIDSKKTNAENRPTFVVRTETVQELKLKAEISNHKAELQYVLEKREQAPDISETIDRIITDKPFWFDLYKSKIEKIRLLDSAIDSCDGNAILAVILFMKRTLIQNIFLDILINKPDALNHYTHYLEQINDIDQITVIYKKQAKNSDAAVNEFRLINGIQQNDINEKIRFLDELKEKYSNTELSTTWIPKYVRLIEFQQKIERSTNGKISFKEMYNAKNKHINVDSAVDTLSYCLKSYNYLPKANHEYSIDKLRGVFELNSKQYACVYIKAMAELYAWSEIDRFTKQPTGLLNSVMMKKTFDIPWECVASIIVGAKAPTDEVKKYVKLIADAHIREQIALKHKLHDLVVEEYKSQRNKQALVQYRSKFSANSAEYQMCDLALKDDTIKWK